MSGTPNNNKFITGVIIGLIIVVAFTIKVMAVEPMKIGQTVSVELEIYPYDQQIWAAEEYLSENGVKIPPDVAYYCNKYGKEYGICPEILEAICWVESNCIADISSADGACKGLMQIKPSSHSGRMSRLNVTDIYSIEGNIKVGADYLAELAEDDEDIAVILARYNGSNDDKVEAVRNGEYTGYVKKVLEIAQALERAHFK